MPVFLAILTKLFTDRALGVLAVRVLDEAAKRTGAKELHDAIHFVAPILGVDLPHDLPAPSGSLVLPVKGPVDDTSAA